MEIKELCIYILRRWRLLIAVALIGAVLLGGYRAAMKVLKGPLPVLTEEEMEERQEELEEKGEELQNTRESIQNKKTELSDYQESVTRYEAFLSNAMDVSRVTASQAVQLVELNEKVAEKKRAVTSTMQQIEDLEKSAVDMQEELEELQQELEETVPVYTVKDIVLGVFFGGLLGVFLMAVYVFMGLFFRKTLRTGEELELWYELPLLCDLYSSGTAGKMAHRGKIDRLLDRIEGNEEPKEPKTEFAVAAAKLQLLAKPEIPVVLVGTVDQEKMDAVYAAMRESLSAQPELIVAGNPMKQPEAALRLSGASVVLVEEAETSKIREVHRLMEFLNLSKTPVIAAIVL